MAELMKQQYDLLTLSIRLDTSSSETMVKLELHNWIQGNEIQLLSLSFPTDLFGFPKNGAQFSEPSHMHDDWFSIPEEALAVVTAALQPIRLDTPDRPLWLQFKGSYGYLAMAPWETALFEKVSLPILRLPCVYAPDPAEYSETLDVVICSSVPDDEIRFHAAQHLREAIGTLNLSKRGLTIHIFVDRRIYDHIQSENWNYSNVILYEPPDGDTFPNSRSAGVSDPMVDALSNPWLRWIRDEMLKCDRLADCMIFVAHGFYDAGQGAIALMDRPSLQQEKSWSQLIHADEIVPFLQQIGAWCCGFCAPMGNYSHAGLRALMDELGQAKPGPVFYYDYYRDPGHMGISKIFEYLFSGESSPEPPASPGISLSCQPYRGMSAQELSTQKMSEGTRSNLDTMSSEWHAPSPIKAQQSVPSWVGAAQRYLEAQRFQVLKTQHKADPDSSTMNQALADALAIGGLQKLVSEIYSSSTISEALTSASSSEEVL